MEQMENESGTRGLARDLAAMRCYATDTDPWTTKHNRSTAICTAAMQQAAGCACADEGRMPTLEGLESQDTDHAQRRHPLLRTRSEEHTSELQSPCNLVCRLLLEKKKNTKQLTTLSTSTRT